MQKIERYILVLEDNDSFASALAEYLTKTVVTHRILVARTVEEAQTLAGSFEFDVFLLDINLPDGTGFDFLCDLRTVQPDARVLMMTAMAVPEYRRQASLLGAVRFLEKPFSLGMAADYLNALLSGSARPDGDHEGAFQGTLRDLSAADIVQMKCLGGATSALEFFGPEDRSGVVYFEQGQIVHVEQGCAEGPDAFFSILGWGGGRFRELEGEAFAPKRTILVDWQNLLLDTVRRLDEKGNHTS